MFKLHTTIFRERQVVKVLLDNKSHKSVKIYFFNYSPFYMINVDLKNGHKNVHNVKHECENWSSLFRCCCHQ